MTRGADIRIRCVPAPKSIERFDGAFVLDENSTVAAASTAARSSRHLLRQLIGAVSGLPLSDGGEEGSIRFEDDVSITEPEAYSVRVDDRQVVIRAGGEAGFVNAVQTLRQLLPPEIFAVGPLRRTWMMPAVLIEDAPRLSWRGVMLDVSRHFIPIVALLRFVELASMHKLNVLHLHLNDDQGWRFPSERYPRLVEVGSWRHETRVGHELDRSGRSRDFDGTPHGGSYTRDELAALVAFAEERNVRIVPEIDLPGHAQAAIASYPELGHVGPVPVWTQWGVGSHILNVSDASIAFCKAIWEEVVEFFPSTDVHIGGDECPRDEWRESPIAAQRIRDAGLSGVDEIQSWFTSELVTHLRGIGRRVVGWDEILEGRELPQGAKVMSWRGIEGGVIAARAGYDVVMSPETPCYLDHYQSDDPSEPLAIGGRNRIEDLYAFEPVPDVLSTEERDRIIGLQANLWTEYTPHPDSVEYMAFPRWCALAERAWSPAGGEYAEFASRLEAHLERLGAAGVNYRPIEGPLPWQQGGDGDRKRFDPGGD